MHVKSKLGGVPKKGECYKCKKCGYDLQETKMLSMSTRTHDYGRLTRDEAESTYYGDRSSRFSDEEENLASATSNLVLEETDDAAESEEESETDSEDDEE